MLKKKKQNKKRNTESENTGAACMEAYSSYRFSQNKVAKVGLVFVLRKRKLKHDVINHNGQCVYFQSYGTRFRVRCFCDGVPVLSCFGNRVWVLPAALILTRSARVVG